MKKCLVLLVALALWPSGALAQAVIVPSPVPACADGEALLWQASGSVFVCGTPSATIADNSITNAKINSAAAIAYSKLALTGAILNADLAGSIAASKLVGSDIATVGTVTTGTWSASTIAVNKGGTGATTLAAHGVVIGNGTSAVAVTGAGTAGQILTSNGASADPTFQAPSGVMTQIGTTQQGTSTSTSATTVATVTISGLTNKDVLYVVTTLYSETQSTSTPFLRHETDGVNFLAMGASVGTNTTATYEARISISNFNNTSIQTNGVRGIGPSAGTDSTQYNASTAFTGTWDLGLRHGGVTSGGTLYYTFRVYKIAG